MTFARHEWSFAHEQTPVTATTWFKNRFQTRQRPKKMVKPIGVPTVVQIAATDNLIATYSHMR